MPSSQARRRKDGRDGTCVLHEAMLYEQVLGDKATAEINPADEGGFPGHKYVENFEKQMAMKAESDKLQAAWRRPDFPDFNEKDLADHHFPSATTRQGVLVTSGPRVRPMRR